MYDKAIYIGESWFWGTKRTLLGAGMVNNDDDGLWGLLKINMNMRVYRERQRRDKERNIFWDCVFLDEYIAV